MYGAGLKNLQANMEDLDHNKLCLSLYRYGAAAEFRVAHQEMIDLYGYGTASAQIAGRQTITMTADFPMDGLKYFARDLIALGEDRDIRDRNPTVQRAYEDYQLLLKLSK